MLTEINFDGIIGPSHNYAGLSLGNIASAHNAGAVSRPREAALQGLEKMRANLALGLAQGWFMPLDRPHDAWLASLGCDTATAPRHVLAQALSASSMWAANAATVSPAPDTADGRCHLTVANLTTMPHRSHEWHGTLAQLQLAFADDRHFAVHAPVPPPFGDEGAANHMRLCARHDQPGVEVFVYGTAGGPFPARQHVDASRAVARINAVNRALFVEQSSEAIAAGAFHNDVVAVANEHVLFAHEQAFTDKVNVYLQLRSMLSEIEIIEVPASQVSLADAISSYLFNAQLVTMPTGGMALIVPTEARDNTAVSGYLDQLVASNGPIREVIAVDVRQSMANGGGPACLRLRVVADPATVDPRFMATPVKIDQAAAVIAAHWPETIAPDDLGNPALIQHIRDARDALLDTLNLSALG
jgi:succinylarginine dihydrolase